MCAKPVETFEGLSSGGQPSLRSGFCIIPFER